MELKYVCGDDFTYLNSGSNRTFMELKLIHSSINLLLGQF